MRRELSTGGVVELIGRTVPVVDELDVPGGAFRLQGPEDIVVLAGKTCYASFVPGRHNLNLKTVRIGRGAYLRNLAEQGHWSVFEHLHFVFRLRRISRVAMAELTRHRHLSFSVESGRFVRPEEIDVVLPTPPACMPRGLYEEIVHLVQWQRGMWRDLQQRWQEAILALPMKERKEVTSYMRRAGPEGRAVTLVVSGNLRAFWEMIGRRLQPAAEVEIREIARAMRELICEACPELVEVTMRFGQVESGET